jgi:uncharacterized protein with HEPN domain
VIAHDYAELDQNLLWLTITRHVPELLGKLEPLVPVDPAPDPGP